MVHLVRISTSVAFSLWFSLGLRRQNIKRTKMYQQKSCGSCLTVHWSEITSVKPPLFQQFPKHLEHFMICMFILAVGLFVTRPEIKKAMCFEAAPGLHSIHVCVPANCCWRVSSLLFVISWILDPRLNWKLFWQRHLEDCPKSLICAQRNED